MDRFDEPDEGDEGHARRPRPLFLLLTSLPWLLVLGLLVLPGRLVLPDLDDPDGVAASASDAHAEHPTAATTGPGPGTPPATADPGALEARLDLEVTELRGQWRVEPGIEEAMALAVVAARAWLTGIDPILPVGGLGPEAPGGYAEHLVVEAVEHPARDAAVVTLLAVMLDTRTLAPSVRRLAVPIAMTEHGPRLAGRPWDLVPPVLDPVTLAREPLEDPDALDAAGTALEAAGLHPVEVVTLHRTSGWPVIAEVRTGQDTAVGGPSDTGQTREIWLRRHLGGFVVSGTTLAGADPTTAAPDPTTPMDAAQSPGG